MVANAGNGQQMITLTDEKTGSISGKIALQIHGGGGLKVKKCKIFVKSL